MKYKVLITALLGSLCSCTQKIIKFQIPPSYEGNLFVVFGVNSDSAITAAEKGNYLIFNIANPPCQATKTKLSSSEADAPILISDSNTGLDIRNDSTGNVLVTRVFNLRGDTLVTRTGSFLVISAYVTKNYHFNDSLVTDYFLIDRDILANKIDRLLK